MDIPREVKNIIEKLEENGYEAYIVGGCVRDFLLGKEPNDWDITTNAKPEEIQNVFPDSFYENKFLTVSVKTGSENTKLAEVEITTFRSDYDYSDKRRPDKVEYAKTLKDDLSRRDFTVNALALKIQNPNVKIQMSKSKQIKSEMEIIDLFGGQEDLKNKIIRTVGNPDERFSEDALRMLRAIRLACVLNFNIEEKIFEAIKKNTIWLEAVSQERIRDEFVKIIMADRAGYGIELLRESGLLKYIIPELLDGVGVSQSKHHIYDCYTHSIKSLDFAVKKNFNFYVRLAALLHDIAKPRVKTGQGKEAIFYNHEIVGAKMAFQILSRLRFPRKVVEKISKLVRFHLFYYNAGQVGAASVRKLIRSVGQENIQELLLLRQADRIGGGVPKAEPYKLRHLKYLIEKVGQDPILPKMLKVNGDDIMKILGIKPGEKIGQILDILLKGVLDNPKKNEKEILEKEVEKLGKLSDNDLKTLADKSKQALQEIETKKDQMTKAKYWVT